MAGEITSEPKALTPLARINAIMGGSAGNLVEWYDWFTYSSFALYFAKHFFPKGDDTAQLLQAAAVFAVGFLARPIGAWIMGLYADRKGRRAGLTLSVALMSVGSFAIAILPDYQTIGALAPALLVMARLLQGLSLGGEYGASATSMTEVAGTGRRGLWSSFQFLTLIAGQLLAIAVLIILQHTLSDQALNAWGWRIPFVIGGVLAVVVFWIRSGLDETPSYLAGKASGQAPSGTMTLIRQFPRETLTIFTLTAAGSLGFYAYTTYMQKFLVNTAGFTKDVATGVTAAALVVYMFVQPAVGWVSDHLGRKNMMGAGFLLAGLATYPVMTTLGQTSSPWVAFLLMSLLVTLLSGYTAVNAALKAELFPAHVRALGVALPYALANAVFGGTAEYVALWFKGGGIESGFFIYLSVMMVGASVVAFMMRNTNVTSLILED